MSDAQAITAWATVALVAVTAILVVTTAVYVRLTGRLAASAGQSADASKASADAAARAADAAERAVLIDAMPVVVPHLGSGPPSIRLYVRNVGRTTALNVSLVLGESTHEWDRLDAGVQHPSVMGVEWRNTREPLPMRLEYNDPIGNRYRLDYTVTFGRPLQATVTTFILGRDGTWRPLIGGPQW